MLQSDGGVKVRYFFEHKPMQQTSGGVGLTTRLHDRDEARVLSYSKLQRSPRFHMTKLKYRDTLGCYRHNEGLSNR